MKMNKSDNETTSRLKIHPWKSSNWSRDEVKPYLKEVPLTVRFGGRGSAKGKEAIVAIPESVWSEGS
jgi:hypothetical protein